MGCKDYSMYNKNGKNIQFNSTQLSLTHVAANNPKTVLSNKGSKILKENKT